MSTKALRTQLLAAIAMVLVAAIALGSSTYAWFVGQNDVTAEGMTVKAQAENGIVIKCQQNGTALFASTATANMTTAAELFPTTTVDLTNWYHAESDEKDNAKALQTSTNYTPLTISEEDAKTETDDYILLKTFTIRSAAEAVPVTGTLGVKTVTVTPVTNTSENLDKAVRVGVKVGDEFFVYAPLADTDTSVTEVGGGTTLTEKKTPAVDGSGNTTDLFTAVTSIPANDTGVTAKIYMWFEGEDTNCKSTNITATLDDLNVTVVFTVIN